MSKPSADRGSRRGDDGGVVDAGGIRLAFAAKADASTIGRVRDEASGWLARGLGRSAIRLDRGAEEARWCRFNEEPGFVRVGERAVGGDVTALDERRMHAQSSFR